MQKSAGLDPTARIADACKALKRNELPALTPFEA
jgi:hypothetical protein